MAQRLMLVVMLLWWPDVSAAPPTPTPTPQFVCGYGSLHGNGWYNFTAIQCPPGWVFTLTAAFYGRFQLAGCLCHGFTALPGTVQTSSGVCSLMPWYPNHCEGCAADDATVRRPCGPDVCRGAMAGTFQQDVTWTAPFQACNGQNACVLPATIFDYGGPGLCDPCYGDSKLTAYWGTCAPPASPTPTSSSSPAAAPTSSNAASPGSAASTAASPAASPPVAAPAADAPSAPAEHVGLDRHTTMVAIVSVVLGVACVVLVTSLICLAYFYGQRRRAEHAHGIARGGLKARSRRGGKDGKANVLGAKASAPGAKGAAVGGPKGSTVGGGKRGDTLRLEPVVRYHEV